MGEKRAEWGARSQSNKHVFPAPRIMAVGLGSLFEDVCVRFVRESEQEAGPPAHRSC